MISSLIEINPAICSGKPVISGTRIMVRDILGLVAGEATYLKQARQNQRITYAH